MDNKYYILERTKGPWSRVMFSEWKSKQFLKVLSREIQKLGYFDCRPAMALVSSKGEKPGTFLFIRDEIREPFAVLFGQLYERFRLGQISEEQSSLEKVVAEYLGPDWLFTGNGLFWLGSLNPDFLFLGDRKKIVECLGEKFHKPDDAQKIITNHLGYGFKTLIIWGRQVASGEFKEMIKRF